MTTQNKLADALRGAIETADAEGLQDAAWYADARYALAEHDAQQQQAASEATP